MNNISSETIHRLCLINSLGFEKTLIYKDSRKPPEAFRRFTQVTFPV